MAARRRKRIFLLLMIGGLLLAGAGLVSQNPQVLGSLAKNEVLMGKLPRGKEAIEELEKRVLGAAGIPDRKEIKGETERAASDAGTFLETEIARVLTVEGGTIQEKTDKIAEIIKKLPEEEAKRVKGEIRRQFCQEFLKEE